MLAYNIYKDFVKYEKFKKNTLKEEAEERQKELLKRDNKKYKMQYSEEHFQAK